MPDSVMRHQSAPLRLVSLRLDVPELTRVALQPGVVEAFRLTVQHHDGRTPDHVATAWRVRGQEYANLQIAYRRPTEKTLTIDLKLDLAKWNAFMAGLRLHAFDTLDDLPNIPWLGADLWLLERAAGSFHHDVIIAPMFASGVHLALVGLIQEHLPQLLREIQA
ncbi:MAG: hypothetical protein OHK0023_03920 [Anaerolineae bacterium]